MRAQGMPLHATWQASGNDGLGILVAGVEASVHMPVTPADFKRALEGFNRGPRSISWIPAFAGMTTRTMPIPQRAPPR